MEVVTLVSPPLVDEGQEKDCCSDSDQYWRWRNDDEESRSEEQQRSSQVRPRRQRAPKIGHLPRKKAVEEDPVTPSAAGARKCKSCKSSNKIERRLNPDPSTEQIQNGDSIVSSPRESYARSGNISDTSTGVVPRCFRPSHNISSAWTKSTKTMTQVPLETVEIVNISGSRENLHSDLLLHTAKNSSNSAKNSIMSLKTSFVAAIEGTKELSLLSDGKQRSPKHRIPGVNANSSILGTLPPSDHCYGEERIGDRQMEEIAFPAKCSDQLRRLLYAQSIKTVSPPSPTSSGPNPSIPKACRENLGKDIRPQAVKSLSELEKRPIFPSLPFSPYGSPGSSPRFRRKPLRETTRVNSVSDDGEFVQLNQYKLEGAIGQGSYGIVKLAYNREDDSSYAMKILSKKKLRRKAGVLGRNLPNRRLASGGAERKAPENPLQKVYREIAIMKKLDHPNVVKLFEVLDDPEDDNLYMVFELVERGEVLDAPTENPLEEKEAWSAFRDVILGMEYLHYQKIIHRDIKPSNLLRADNGQVKIGDLGVSNEFDGDDAFLTNTAGTPAFTPPESLCHKPGGEPYSGKAADIWSLGVTLYTLVTGRIPFHDDNILALYSKIKMQDFEFPANRDLSPEIRDLIGKMLVKDPSQRITLSEIKIHDWVTGYGLYPMPSEEENCRALVEVTEEEVKDSIHSVPKLDTLILVKAMIKNHSFSNPFSISAKHKFQKSGRSNSAPETFEFYNRKLDKLDSSLPVVSEEEKTEEEH